MSDPRSRWQRFRALRDDRLLWILLTTSAARSLGRGLLISLSTLYFTRALGISITDVGRLLFTASLFGLIGAWLGGQAADRLPARRLIGMAFFGETIALLGYAAAPLTGLPVVPALTVLAASASLCNWFGGTVTQAVVARGFIGAQRVRTQAMLRTVLNTGIALGSGLAAIPLALDLLPAFQATLVVASIAYAAAGIRAHQLPSSVDARPASTAADPVIVSVDAPSPWRNPRFLLLSAASGLVAINFMVTDLAHPQWVSAHTAAPPVLVSALLVVNTVLVVALQVPMSRRTVDITSSGRVLLGAGAAFAVGAVLAWWAGEFGLLGALLLMMAATVVHAIAEVASSSAMWALSYALTPRSRAGSYQGLTSAAAGLGLLVAPLLITYTALSIGLAGWLVLGAVLAVGCLLAVLATRGAEPADASAA